MNFRNSHLVKVCLLALSAGLAVQAAPIGFAVDTANDNLLSIDLGTGATTVIGAIGFGDFEALSFQPGTGILYGLDDVSDTLITINTTTGAGTAVGPMGNNFDDAGLAFDDVGNLFAASDLSGDGVFTVDVATGAATEIGEGGPDNFAMAFGFGQMYGMTDDGTPDGLTLINLTNGFTTRVQAAGLGFSIDEGDLTFDQSGILWFIDAGNENIYQIDRLTGAATSVATIDCHPNCRIEGLAVNVPEPSTMVLLGSATLFLLRRRFSGRKSDDA